MHWSVKENIQKNNKQLPSQENGLLSKYISNNNKLNTNIFEKK